MTKPSILGFQLPNMPQPPNMRAKLDDELARQRYIEQVKQMQEQMREYALQNAERFEQEKLKYAQQLEDMKNAASEVMEQELNRRMGDLGRTITNAIKQGISEAVQELSLIHI